MSIVKDHELSKAAVHLKHGEETVFVLWVICLQFLFHTHMYMHT